ncbi:MAG: hypothetical protein WCL30_03670, partial [Pseudomonadota bacterium]
MMCDICNNSELANTYNVQKGRYDPCICQQCGKYQIIDATNQMSTKYNKIRHVISHYVRKEFDETIKSDSNFVVDITLEKLQKISSLPEMTLVEKIDALLLAYAKDLETYDQEININNKKYIAQ